MYSLQKPRSQNAPASIQNDTILPQEWTYWEMHMHMHFPLLIFLHIQNNNYPVLAVFLPKLKNKETKIGVNCEVKKNKPEKKFLYYTDRIYIVRESFHTQSTTNRDRYTDLINMPGFVFCYFLWGISLSRCILRTTYVLVSRDRIR